MFARIAAPLAALMVAACPTWAADLTVVGAGGALQEAERKAFFQPFAEQTGIRLTEDSYSGQMAKVRAMVSTGSVTWDVMQIEQNTMLAGCDEGLFEKVDWARIGRHEDFLPEAISPCGVGAFVWSMVLTYDRTRLKDGPADWKGFWDTARWPGKRGLRATAKMTLEVALLSDGVAPAEVYKVLSAPGGVDRAFARLDKLKPDVLWWTAGAEPIERVASGDLVMAAAFNGRVAAANAADRRFALVWDGQVYGMDYWGIVKGSRNRDAAEKFLAFAARADVQKRFPDFIAYGVTNRQAIAAIEPAVAAGLPTTPANMARAVGLDTQFWADQGEVLEARFATWRSR